MKRKTAVFLLVLLAVSAAVYGAGLRGGFVWDDDRLIVQKSAFFEDPGNILRILSTYDDILTERSTPYYRPLTNLGYMADRHVWGSHPFGYHLENLLLHAGVAALVWLLIAGAFGDGTLAFFCALLFAVHPVAAEAVNFVSARNNLLCAAWMACALLLLRKGTAAGGLASLAAYFLALMSKEPAVALPFFLLSLALLSGEGKLRAGKGALAGFFAVTGVYFLLRLKILGTLTTEAGVEFSLERLGLVASTLSEDFRLLLFPLRLNALYTEAFLSFRPYHAALAAAGVAALVWLGMWRRSPEPLRAGSLWVLWGLLPVSNVVLIPSAPVAERYLYIPLMGFSVMAGYGLHALYRRKPAWGWAALVGVSLLLGARAFERNFAWRDNTALYRSMIQADPENAKAHYNLGFEHVNAGRGDLAFREWTETIRLDPRHAKAYNNVGNLYSLAGDYRSALPFYEKTLRLAPEEFVVHFNLARAADLLGDKEIALRHYRAFLDKAGSSPVPEHREKAAKSRERMAALREGASRR